MCNPDGSLRETPQIHYETDRSIHIARNSLDIAGLRTATLD